MVPEDRFRQEVVDELLRCVLDHGDLLEDHFALGIEIDKGRGEDHVGHDVQRLLEVLVQHAGVDDGVVAGGRRVQLAAEAVEDLRDLLRGVLLRPLEEQVLQEMCDTRVGIVLVAQTPSRSRGRSRRSEPSRAAR